MRPVRTRSALPSASPAIHTVRTCINSLCVWSHDRSNLSVKPGEPRFAIGLTVSTVGWRSSILACVTAKAREPDATHCRLWLYATAAADSIQQLYALHGTLFVYPVIRNIPPAPQSAVLLGSATHAHRAVQKPLIQHSCARSMLLYSPLCTCCLLYTSPSPRD